MIPIPRDFRDFIALLNERRVRYLVVGGYAVAYHGYPRATGDLDLFIELSRKNAGAMVAVFKSFGFESAEITPEFFMEKGQVVRLGREPMKLEILNDISGVAFAECHRHRIRARIGGLRINFIDLPHLLRNKRASGRDKDLLDIKNLPPSSSSLPRDPRS
jgi:hypothetical protein